MIQDSHFQVAFWQQLTPQAQQQYLSPGLKTLTLTSNMELIELTIDDGTLIQIKNGVPTQFIELIQTTLTLDEAGLTLANQYGSLVLNGTQLRELHETIHSHCLHTNILEYFEIGSLTYESPSFKIFAAIDKCSRQTCSVKSFHKSYLKESLKLEIAAHQKLDLLGVYEDQESIQLVIPQITGHMLKDSKLGFIEMQFGLLKMAHKFHCSNLIIVNLNADNIMVLDDNYSMMILDWSKVTPYKFEQQILQEQTNQGELDQFLTIAHDIYTIGVTLRSFFPDEPLILNFAPIEDRPSAQEILFEQCFQHYFGESEFFRLLNARPYQQQNNYQPRAFEVYLNNQIAQIDTFNAIHQCMKDSDDENEQQYPTDLSISYYQQVLKGYRNKQYTDELGESPMLSPRVQQVTRHKHKQSSRVFLLETLLQENIINQKQYEQLFAERDFLNQQELIEFGAQIQKEIRNSSNLTTPTQSNNSTCPNSILPQQVNKQVINRITDLIVEVQQELCEKQQQKVYNINKVHNVRKNLFKMQLN